MTSARPSSTVLLARALFASRLAMVLLGTLAPSMASAAVTSLDLPGRSAANVAVAPDAASFRLSEAGLSQERLGDAGFDAHPDRALILQDGQRHRVPIDRLVAQVHLLHGLVPGAPIAAYRSADQAARDAGEQPTERPTVVTVDLIYADGQRIAIGVRYQEGIGAIVRPWWHPVEGFPHDLAHARLIWQTPLPPIGRTVACLHAMRIPNPRPAVAISAIELVPAAGLGDGRHLTFGLSIDDDHWPGATRFVAVDGDDSADGSWDQPWATLGHATTSIAAGDRVYLHAGTWRPTTRIAFRDLHADEGRHTLVSNWPGAAATIDFIDALWDDSPEREKLGFEVYPHDASMLHSFRCTRFRFNGLTVIRSRARGIGTEQCRGNVLSHNTVFKTFGPGIRFSTGSGRSGGRVTGNRIIRATSLTMAPDGAGGVGGYINDEDRWVYRNRNGDETNVCPMEALDVGSSSDIRIDHNEVAWAHKELCLLDGTISDVDAHHNYLHDALKRPNIAGIGPNGYGTQTRIAIHHNIAHDVGFAYTIGTEGGGGGSTDHVIHHNIAWNCLWGMVNVGPGLNDVGDGSDVERVGIFNNTYWQEPSDDYGRWATCISLTLRGSGDNPGDLRDVTVANNLLANHPFEFGPAPIKLANGTVTDAAAANVVSTNNIATLWRSGRDNGLESASDQIAADQMVDPATWGFQLAPQVLAAAAGVGLHADGTVDPEAPATSVGALPYRVARAPFDSPTVGIVPIGDSITQGGRRDREEYTYRWPLFTLLLDAGIEVDLIGSRQHGLHNDALWPDSHLGIPFDRDHEGYYGATTATVRDRLPAAIAAWSIAPDIALIHLGTNDQDAEADYAVTVIEPLRQMIGLLRAQNPTMTILLGQLFFTGGEALRLRPLVEDLAAELDSPASRVATVAHYQDFKAQPGDPDSDTFDWAHPDASGQLKMAEAWLSRLRELGIRPIAVQLRTIAIGLIDGFIWSIEGLDVEGNDNDGRQLFEDLDPLTNHRLTAQPSGVD